MVRQNRRSKRTSVTESSPSPANHTGEEGRRQEESRTDDLEKENEYLKGDIEALKHRLANVSSTSVDDDSKKLHALEVQLSAKKQSSSKKQRNGEAGISLQDEIQRLKAQKVQLLCKSKLESMQFRLSKASLEKQVLQLKKEQRKNDYEMRKLLALNEKQKLVLQRKTEEASLATKRLNKLLESRKASSHKPSGSTSGTTSAIQGLELELKIAARVEEIRSEYERQMEEMADEVRKFEEEAEMLRQENFGYLLQDKEIDCKVKDSELRDLKEEVTRLNNLINYLGLSKAQIHAKKQNVDLVKSSGSAASSIEFMDTSQSENSRGSSEGTEKSTPRVCCSCSKKSLCKTSKCECRAAEGSCGTGCGCAVSKCTNRKFFIKVDGSLQLEVARDSVHSSGTSETEKGVVTSQPAETNNDCAPRRKPLCEIGNKQLNLRPTKAVRKMRGRKPVAQIDAVDQVPESVAGPKREDKIAAMDGPTKLTRAKQLAVSNKNT